MFPQGGLLAEIGGRSEALVDQYVAEGKTAEAVALLFDLIVESAKKKDFPKAEALRDKRSMLTHSRSRRS
jgi:polyhydroxyalkanoate synthesis regulator phasin